MKNIRTLFDFIFFVFLKLNPKNGIFLVISIVTLSVSIISYFKNIMLVSSFTMLLGAIGIIYSLYKIRLTVFSKPKFNYEEDDATTMIISELKLSSKCLNKGFEIIALGGGEKITFSNRINEDLQLNNYETTISKYHKKNLSSLLKKNSDNFEKILRYQYLDSIHRNPPKSFTDENKVCLGSDDFLESKSIKIYKGSYYASFLTNEFCQKKITSRTARVVDIFSGHNLYPAYKDNEHYILKEISQSYLGNHIGISTLAFTKDYKIVIWRQANTSQQSSFKWVPTGSGSINWSDYCAGVKFNELIKKSVERELLEESNKNKFQFSPNDYDTKLLGYYRLLRRGAKPEFCCVTKLSIDSSELEPNENEVDIPLQHKYIFEADTISVLLNNLEKLYIADSSSVSLKMNSYLLKQSIIMKEDYWSKYFELN